MECDVVVFLNELCGIETYESIDDMPRKPEDLPPDLHFEWDERAAIMEYHGGLMREHAEAEALKDILRQRYGENGILH